MISRKYRTNSKEILATALLWIFVLIGVVAPEQPKADTSSVLTVSLK
jgi:hypothetical protein